MKAQHAPGYLVALVVLACGCAARDSSSSCNSIASGALVITEFMADPEGKEADTNEWMEIFNATPAPIDLSGLKVVISTDLEGSPDKSRSFLIPSEGVEPLAAGGYRVIGQWVEAGRPAWAPGSIATGAAFPEMSATTGTIRLECGGTVVDEIVYKSAKEGISASFGGDPAKEGAKANDEMGSWCLSRSSFGAEKGTPGKENDPCADNVCREGGKWTVLACPPAGAIVITELMPSPGKVDDAKGEWFEVLVKQDLYLNGIEFGPALDDPESKYRTKIDSVDCLTAKAGDYLLFARSDKPDLNGGLPAVFQTFSFTLKGSDGALFAACGGAILDKVTWKSDPGNQALGLDPDNLDAAANDDPNKWCKSNKNYGAGDFGTPGAPNPQCP